MSFFVFNSVFLFLVSGFVFVNLLFINYFLPTFYSFAS
jgi:hypothetical protein